jgi:thiol-disulfide isomerase/thioredoxin
MNPNFLMWFYYILPADEHNLLDAYIEKVSHENMYPRVRSEAIAYFLFSAEMEKDSSKIQKYYKRLISECPGTFRATEAKFKYDILAPGKQVPSFSVTSIDNPGETYTDKTMLGKIYLIEFWTTTCGHCKREMPFLHDAYEKYKNKGFEILSLSLDRSPVEVIEYRKGEWKMSWHHAFLEGEFDHEIAKKFGVRGTPTPILIDSEGKIIVTGNALRNVDLIETLADYFKK